MTHIHTMRDLYAELKARKEEADPPVCVWTFSHEGMTFVRRDVPWRELYLIPPAASSAHSGHQ